MKLDTTSETYDAGKRACIAGHPIEDNPYTPASRPTSYCEWRAGWLEAKDEAVQLPGEVRSQVQLGNEKAHRVDLTNPESPIYVLYHASCADGFAAAFVCWLAFGDVATYIPVQYGQPMPEIPDHSRVFIVDFSYSEAELLALTTRSQMVQVIDHHKTAVANLENLHNDGCDHRFFKTFDMEHSGAVLTWLHFFPEEPVPLLLRYVEDRDLWRWQLPHSHEISAALALEMEMEQGDFKHFAELMHEGLHAPVAAGAIALKLINQTARRAAKKAKMGSVDFHYVPVVNCTAFISETCHEMLQLYPEAKFVAAYFDNEKGQRIWSLRSRADFDVSEVARKMGEIHKLGGGGHPQAAGFTTLQPGGTGIN